MAAVTWHNDHKGAAGESRRLFHFKLVAPLVYIAPFGRRLSRLVALPVSLALLGGWAPGASAAAGPAHRRDILSSFAACVNAAPSQVSPERPAARVCSLPSGKNAGLELVAEDAEDFVMMDVKMTSCPANGGLPGLDHPEAFRYVHLLALPRRPVSGVEDARRRDAPHLWRFAWDTARRYLPQDDLVLAVNPRAKRTQDQLHVHATRFAAGARDLFLAAASPAASLDGVWETAERRAAALAAGNGVRPGSDGRFLSSGRFGIAAARGRRKGFAVLVVLDESPESAFSAACPRR